MAYNSYFPMNYQGYYPTQSNAFPTQMNVGANQSNAQNSLIWVQGEGAAKSYLVAPGCTVALFDNESQTIYIKTADASGMPSMKVIDYKVRNAMPEQTPSVSPHASYATKDDVSMLQAEIDRIRNEMKGMINNEQPVISSDDGRTA